MCSSRKIHTHLFGRSLEIPRGRGVLKVKILEAKYEAKLESPGGRRLPNKKPSVGGVWIFSGTAQFANKNVFFALLKQRPRSEIKV